MLHGACNIQHGFNIVVSSTRTTKVTYLMVFVTKPYILIVTFLFLARLKRVSSSKKISSKYIPSRDIPIAVKELQTTSPTYIVAWIKGNKTEKDKRTGKRQQKIVTPQSITMWFKRHPKIAESLQSEIVETELPKEAVSETLFQNGVFKEIDCINRWIRDLTLRKAKPRSIYDQVRYVKKLCLGEVGTETLEGWGLKHPDNLTVEDALNYVFAMEKKKLYTRNARISFRTFFRSRGIAEREISRISAKSEEAGKYAHLYAPKEKIYAIFDLLKYINETVWRAAKFSYKTACRSGATFRAEYKHINFEEHTIVVFEKASRGQEKRRFVKFIPLDLWRDLDLDNAQGRKGRLFDVKKGEVNRILKDAYEKVIPELIDEIVMPFHFWRHQFAQHMLRAMKWNYTFVAELGGWTEDVLKRYYGKPPQEVIRQAGLEALPNI